MKKLLLSLALMTCAAPAFADPLINSNNAALGMQTIAQNGVFNRASNDAFVAQSALSAGPRHSPYSSLVNNNVNVGTQVIAQTGDNNEAANTMLTSQNALSFGGGALVNNNVNVGTQVTVQTGLGNRAGNGMLGRQAAGGVPSF